MASTRVFLVLQLIALAYSANWLDDPELVEEERALEDQESITWLDEMELDEDDFEIYEDEVSDSGTVFSGSLSKTKRGKSRNNKKTSVGDPRLTCENLWQDIYCEGMTSMCKRDDDDDEIISKKKRHVRTHCRKSCNLCRAKKLPDKYVARIQGRKDIMSNTCEDTKETSLCQKVKDKCTTGGIRMRIQLLNRCRKTCGFC